MSDYPIWLDGKPVEGTGELQVVNPATEEVFATISRSDQAMADRAVASAKTAQNNGAICP